ncbi:MAG: pilus assembly protein N-terminal domain-containing protein [Methylacidiphilales bacterium]|nr:pilus assembly protein N-terminal domain-containing protein [Candidatus Methylacidiphilales bacterium]
MKQLHQLLPPRSLALLGCLLALWGGLARAQTPIAEPMDVFFGESKQLPLDRPIDDFSVTPDNVIKVEKLEGSPNVLTITAMSAGNATLTVKSDGRTLLYDVAVSPAPERLYINLNESKRLSFPNPIDDQSVSQAGVVHVVQPDSTDKVLLVEAINPGKTTLTVYSKGEIYRYFISTFENRGADVLAIQNAFSAKGYRNLTITFTQDQAVIGGTVPTQEELDDAVRIVKQYTDYVVVKATLGQLGDESEFNEQEQIIVNNIQRIANVKGLTIRVKFPEPTVITTSTYTKSTGDYVEPETTTTPQGGTIRGGGFQPPSNQQQGPNNTGPTELKPQQNTTETVTTTENTSIPEKIFLYGDLQDDLEEARVIRVARTFCPFVVSFLTVKDPIQLRTQVRFMQVQDTDTSNTGFFWTGGAAGSMPTIALGMTGNGFAYGGLHSLEAGFASPAGLINNFVYGINGAVNAEATLELFETLGITKELRETDIFLTNGQPGWYSEGEVESYVSSSVTTASSPPITTLTASFVFLGVNLDISPLNLVNAGGVEPTGQKIYGIPSSIGSGSSSFTVEQDSDAAASKVSTVSAPIEKSGTVPFLDSSVKYVDENGLIGLNVSTQLTLPDGSLNAVTVSTTGGEISLPNFFVRTTRTRVNLRDGQTVAINGLIDREISHNITQIPFLANIPLFGALFKGHTDAKTDNEVIVLVTPHIVRMRDPDSARYPKPLFPELQDMAREDGQVPIIKPVRYDAGAVDLRPETPKDMKATQSAETPVEPPPLAPHATGGMQTLQPAADSTSPRPVDNAAPASDASQQTTTNAPPNLAPSSTLP